MTRGPLASPGSCLEALRESRMCPFWKILAPFGVRDDREEGRRGREPRGHLSAGLGRVTGDPLYLVCILARS